VFIINSSLTVCNSALFFFFFLAILWFGHTGFRGLVLARKMVYLPFELCPHSFFALVLSQIESLLSCSGLASDCDPPTYVSLIGGIAGTPPTPATFG
jgi:hypothetical protein